LHDERDRRGDVEVRRLLDVRLPRDRERDDQRMQGEDVDEPRHAVLVEEHEAHQHEAAGEEVGNVEGDLVHQATRDTTSRSAARKPSIKAAPRKSETRNTRIFAMAVSNTASRKPAAASLRT